ncbi:MAG: lysyl oxidase family protein [Thermoleophilia bacterium]
MNRIPAPALRTALAGLAIAAAAASTAAAAPPRAALLAVRPSITADQTFPGSPAGIPVFAYLVNRGGPVDVEVRRTPGTVLWTGQQVVDGARAPLPAGVPVGPFGFGRAVEVTVLTPSRRVVRRRALNLCVNANRVRLGTSGPALSAYPESCTFHPFARALHLGLDTDYAVPVALDFNLGRFAPGRYLVRVRIRPALAEWLGMDPKGRAVQVKMRVPKSLPIPVDPGGGKPVPAKPVLPTPPHSDGEAPARPPAVPVSDVPLPADTLPNLAGLPAFDISVRKTGSRDMLLFGATVWNAGPGPMIIEGYRSGPRLLMDGYQFFRRDGQDVASVPVSKLEYDLREGHDHWHFRDFAEYALVRADGRVVRRSPKEAWCLAPTDQIDQLVPNAEIRPGNPLLATACGDRSAVQVREVLEVGAGDTYSAETPGQAIDVTRVPNGVYFLSIEANPGKVMRETTTDDNTALRRIVLGGTRGNRTVRVPPVDGLDTERFAACRPYCPAR